MIDQKLKHKHLEYSVLNRVVNLQLVYINVPLLTETVGSVKCLILKGRIPPQIHEDHVVTSGQVQACVCTMGSKGTKTYFPNTHQCSQP